MQGLRRAKQTTKQIKSHPGSASILMEVDSHGNLSKTRDIPHSDKSCGERLSKEKL
jgi:hypothetical protein